MNNSMKSSTVRMDDEKIKCCKTRTKDIFQHFYIFVNYFKNEAS